jgi:hypothetical protein
MSEQSFNKRLSTGQVDLARLIVCERTGRWAIALSRELRSCRIRVYQTRSLAECWAMLAEYGASFLVVEVTPSNLEVLPSRLSEIEGRFPVARVGVVGDRAMGECEFLLREAGTIHFTTSPRLLRGLAIAAQKHLNHVPKPRLSLVETIWDALPWKG